MVDVIVIGGGLAGLINTILLSREGLEVCLIEKKKYPFHRVCGEYISNEVKPFLKNHGLFPDELEPASITHLQLSAVSGKSYKAQLGLGGFGISRYALDQHLAEKAKESGAEILENTKVTGINYTEDHFEVEVSGQLLQAKLVIGAFGKRTQLDAKLQRSFMARRSPYMGVKYHIKTDFPKDLVSLHNFKNGYCGMSNVGGNLYNLCYLSHRDNIRGKNLDEMEQEVLLENPHLRRIWNNSDFIFEKPLVINEISFEKKKAIEGHLLMSGDSAGMITPLCGNGMAMAIRSAKLLSELILKHWKSGEVNREKLEVEYQQVWDHNFSLRLRSGRWIQRLFGSRTLSEMSVKILSNGYLGHRMIALTHGKEFK